MKNSSSYFFLHHAVFPLIQAQLQKFTIFLQLAAIILCYNFPHPKLTLPTNFLHPHPHLKQPNSQEKPHIKHHNLFPLLKSVWDFLIFEKASFLLHKFQKL
ncbi:hypothetical protein ACKWTF_009445 [Chironomus riparius]